MFNEHEGVLQSSASMRELVVTTNDQDSSTGCPISSAQWSKTRPMVFGVTSANTLKLFDLVQGEAPVLSIPHDEPLTCLAFNKSGYET